MLAKEKFVLLFLLPATLVAGACGGGDSSTPVEPPPPTELETRVVVDAAKPLGDVMRLERAATTSTSSALPSDATRAWLQGLDFDVVRVWIQLRNVYNNGDVDYNAEYSSGVGTEESLAFYSSVADRLLVVLSAQYPSSTWSLPEGDAYVDLIKETLIHYKTEFPKIKYVQVGNEPDHAEQTVACPAGDPVACTPPSREYYYPMYRAYYRAINEVNAELGLEDDPILISNGAITGNLENMLEYADDFFAAYAADPDPEKKFDVFTFHSYGETDDPLTLTEARGRIEAAMQAHGLPAIPIFVTEFGMQGGSSLGGMTEAEAVTAEPAAMLTKALYLYEGGINVAFNWSIHHATLEHKSLIADVENAYAYPFGNALLLARAVSDRETRIEATSNHVSAEGLGTHALASMAPGKGIAVLVWNYNWTSYSPTAEFNVAVKNIPQAEFGGGQVHASVYVVDSDHNNYFTNPSQTSLQVTREEDLEYSSGLTIPVELEKNAVALIVLTPE